MAAPVFAYDIQPSKSARLYGSKPVHELLSIASVECMRAMVATSGKPPFPLWNCLPEQRNFANAYSISRWEAALQSKAEKEDYLRYLLQGVRWADDPTGLLRSNPPARAIVNYSLCNSWLKGDFGACGNRFCLSHFGHLQMAHSMKPSAPWCPGSNTCGVAALETKDAIEAWVRWLIPVGQGAAVPSAEVFDQNSLANSFFDEENCPKVYPPGFTYQSLFFVDCSKDRWKRFLPWNWRKSWGKCPIVAPTQSDELKAALKARAIGTILHVIQDSYARGHTLRVAISATDSCSPWISCTRIRKFSDYNAQDSDKHKQADRIPEWDASCLERERQVDDPITAGAKVLRMFEVGSSADEIWCYLSEKVFVMGDEPTTDELSKDYACFGKG